MPLFSQRKGLKPLSKALQIDSMDSELINSLWSILHECYWNKYTDQFGRPTHLRPALHSLIHSIWFSYFKEPTDTIPEFDEAVRVIKQYFFRCSWNDAYDLIEFIVKHSSHELGENFPRLCNGVLERENSGYRFVDTEVTQITAPEEIESVEHALSSGIEGVRIHLAQALSLLSDRKSPDYRNSIKESISAVEAICRLVSGDEKATLGDALKRIGATQAIHPALENAFSALYGYTSDKGGIRHSLLEEATLSFTDAKFMLVTCSAFVNYMLGKAADLGISLKKR